MLTDKLAVITGVSSGIGKELLLTLQKEGCIIHGIVKSEERKQSLTEELSTVLSSDALARITLHVCDLRHPSEIEAFAQNMHKLHLSPDILVLNAGVGFYGPHEELSVKNITELTAVNLTAPLLLSNLFLRDLKKNQGHLLCISSVTAAKNNNTHGCAYGATKAGLSSFAKSLFEEVRKYDVRVTVLAPDMTQTDLYRNASFCAAEDTDAALTPQEIADYALFALTARKGLNLTELTMQPQRHRLERRNKTLPTDSSC